MLHQYSLSVEESVALQVDTPVTACRHMVTPFSSLGSFVAQLVHYQKSWAHLAVTMGLGPPGEQYMENMCFEKRRWVILYILRI